ncbi:MAG: YebC/PmpR family DNA-binding transcriptional regulator [Ethanoligenens sp.]|uniref:YebC/PmpR family DNA-binding transcriptional regulator n=1 Tax=Ethanoligenens sp. TaxID=2099655 RepID=UPI0039EC47A6
MSGHSKWKNIMHRKEKSDAQRAKIFTKIGREIAVVVKQGGADPSSNSKLYELIAKAKANNVPNDNIERIIKKAAGGQEKDDYEDIVYEGYGPCGAAVVVETLTDNRNRTAADLRHYFDKFGGNLGQTGCVGWMFQEKGVIVVEKANINEDKLMEDCLEAGAVDFNSDDEIFEVFTDPLELSGVRTALEQKGYVFLSAQEERIPANYVRIPSEDDRLKMQNLLDSLEDDDDVQNVWHNWENDGE